MFDEPEICEAAILGRFRRPQHEGRCEGETHYGELTNSRSGIELGVSLRVGDGAIACARFEGGGCSVSVASSSFLVCLIEGRAVEDARRLVALYREMMDAEGGEGGERFSELGSLQALRLVRGMPDRKASALLAAGVVARLLSP